MATQLPELDKQRRLVQDPTNLPMSREGAAGVEVVLSEVEEPPERSADDRSQDRGGQPSRLADDRRDQATLRQVVDGTDAISRRLERLERDETRQQNEAALRK